jgi:hypothetical protein
MTDLNRVNSSNLDAIKSDGTATPANRDGAPSTWGVTLASGTTYYFPIGAPKAPVPAESIISSIHVRGDSAIICAITIEDCNFGATRSPGDGRGDVDVSDFELASTAGNWIPENPSSASVGTVGAGWVATGATVNVAGGAAGGCMFHVGNMGSRRLRLKIVVAGTGGKVRVGVHGKGM